MGFYYVQVLSRKWECDYTPPSIESVAGRGKTLPRSWYRYLKNNISVILCLIEGELFSIPDIISLESTGYRILIWGVSFFCLLTSLERASPPLRPHTKRKGMVERKQAIFSEKSRMPQRQVGCGGGRQSGTCKGRRHTGHVTWNNPLEPEATWDRIKETNHSFQSLSLRCLYCPSCPPFCSHYLGKFLWEVRLT